MLFALLAAFCFACSGVSAQQSSRIVGPIKANALRLGFAAIVLAVWTSFSGGIVWDSIAAKRLFISGAIGFGLGDMALFFALPRLGARHTLLINLCTAPVFGSLGDWLLLGSPVTIVQGIACMIILLGVGIALLGKRQTQQRSGSRVVGLCAAFIAGAGQGTGATLSRWAHVAESAEGVMLQSHAETLLRVLPGLAVVSLFWLVVRWMRPSPTWAIEHPLTPRGTLWIIANATAGAIVGVTFFQHALLHASSAIVLSITATTPIMVMPLTFYSERDVPSATSGLGAGVAVAGVVMLKLWT